MNKTENTLNHSKRIVKQESTTRTHDFFFNFLFRRTYNLSPLPSSLVFQF